MQAHHKCEFKKFHPLCDSEGLVPVAIHCEPGSEETSHPRYARHDGLPRRLLVLPPRNDRSVYGYRLHPTYSFRHIVIARAKPVAIHCSTKSEPHTQIHPVNTRLTIRLNI